MEEKDTAIALLEISDASHGHREKMVELQEQKNILMKMIKQHVCMWLSIMQVPLPNVWVHLPIAFYADLVCYVSYKLV